MICHVSIHLIHPRYVVHSENSRGVPNVENGRTKNIFYLDLKHVHKYGCAKFQPNPLFSSQQTATESAAEEKKKKKKKSANP